MSLDEVRTCAWIGAGIVGAILLFYFVFGRWFEEPLNTLEIEIRERRKVEERQIKNAEFKWYWAPLTIPIGFFVLCLEFGMWPHQRWAKALWIVTVALVICGGTIVLLLVWAFMRFEELRRLVFRTRSPYLYGDQISS